MVQGRPKGSGTILAKMIRMVPLLLRRVVKKSCFILWGMAWLGLVPLGAWAKTTHVVIVVLDQMRPDYIDTYPLKNLRKLRSQSLNFSNARVGHFPTNTIIGHAVLGTAVFPKRFGFTHYVWRDEEGWLGKRGNWYRTWGLSLKQFRSIFRHTLKKPTALALLKKKLGGKIIAVGEKNYATMTLGGLDADIVVTLKKVKEGRWQGHCIPDGWQVPNYISKPDGGRFYLHCSSENHYGTKETLYPLDGHHYVPGEDPHHQGGDVWAMDAALALMDQEPWRVMMITLGGIDRLGHIFGEMDNPKQQKKAKRLAYNFAKMLTIADAQIGRLLEALENKGLLRETLLILTADHGGFSAAKNFYGAKTLPKDFTNCSYGPVVNERESQLSEEVSRWIDPRLVHHTQIDTAGSIWLKDTTPSGLEEGCNHFIKIPGAVAVYKKTSNPHAWEYERCAQNRVQNVPPFLDPVTLLNTSATKTSADLVVQLEDESGYCILGDHGGLQEKASRIPMLVYSQDLPAGSSGCPVRLVDIMPLVFHQTGTPPPNWMDGNAHCLSFTENSIASKNHRSK